MSESLSGRKVMAMYQILIVDDDVQMLDMVELVLRREGYDVLRANSGQHALEMLRTTSPDLFVIDMMMPGIDGLSLVRRLRENPDTATSPIIFLTGAPAHLGVVDALDSGADDYLRKPFVARELSARVRSLIRRTTHYVEAEAPEIRLYQALYQVGIGVRLVTLTPVEFELLKFLCKTPFEMHTAEDMLMKVWHYPHGVGDAALVRNHVRNIRRKIELDPDHPTLLQSRHGRGYVVKARATIVESADARFG
jgi:DNA-binding response OmpR family regulator